MTEPVIDYQGILITWFSEFFSKERTRFRATLSPCEDCLLTPAMKSATQLAATTKKIDKNLRPHSLWRHKEPLCTLLSVSQFISVSVCRPRSGRPSLSRWLRECRLQPSSWALCFWSPASPGWCGRLSAPRPSGSGRTCSSRYATACTASWT